MAFEGFLVVETRISFTSENDCSYMLSELESILLFQRGVDRESLGLHVCKQCDDNLRKRDIPKFAIKNGFCISSLPPNLQQATLPKDGMTQLVIAIVITRVMRGCAHRAICFHWLTFDATPGPPAMLLPTPMRGLSSYRVVMVGPFTTIQQTRVHKMDRVRQIMVEVLLRFYRAHIWMYAHVAVDFSQLAEDQVPVDMLDEGPNAKIDAEAADLEDSRVGGVADNDSTVAEAEVVERVVVASDDREVATLNDSSATDARTGSEEIAHTAVEIFKETSSARQAILTSSAVHVDRSTRGYRHVSDAAERFC